jgi:hypothetical protein
MKKFLGCLILTILFIICIVLPVMTAFFVFVIKFVPKMFILLFAALFVLALFLIGDDN